MTGSTKFDWWGWLKGRFGGSPTKKVEDPIPEPPPPPKKRRRRPKDGVFVWPDGEEYWNRRLYMAGDWGGFDFSYHKCKKGEIGSSATREKSVWQVEKTADGREHYYLSCIKCAAVNDFSNHRIEKDGKVSPCVVCVKCREHTWIQLEGWTGEERKETRTAADLAWERKWEEDAEKWRKENEAWLKEYEKKYPKTREASSPGDIYGSWF